MVKLLLKPITIAWIVFGAFLVNAQEYNTFEVRYENNLRGDLTFIGNNILNRDSGTPGEGPNDAYNNLQNTNTWSGANNDLSGFTNYNDYKNMQFIDVDNDPSTFNSSSSTFVFDNPDCSLIRYAGLYWTATYPSDTANGSFDGFTYVPNNVPVGTNRRNDFDQVRFRVPGGSYVDITADEVLYDGFTSTDPDMQLNSPYACYADVTSLVTALTNPQGEYTVANIRATTGGLTPGGGSAGGWTLIIVYENPNLAGRYITTFDGFARVNGTNSVDIDYTGFTTIPAGPVSVDLGAATLEGDFRIVGDGLSIRAASNTTFVPVGDAANPVDNFFNSNISLDGAITTNRTPASANTLGFDTDVFFMPNGGNSIIPNNETAATFRFSTDGDQFYPFFNSFNVEIIEPNIILEKRVEDIAGNDITGAGVNLGQLLDYVLSFENIGNDDAVNYTIRDVLPINVTLDESNMVLPLGVTYTYDSATRTVVFSIPDSYVLENAPITELRMRVQVAENCFDFIDACTDQIENIAFSTYFGRENTAQITDDPSVSDFDICGFVTPGATNFLLDDLENCDFSRTVQLCGDNVLLDAGDNFDEYIWYIDENQDGLIDAGDTVITDIDGNPDNDPSTILVNETGVYIVDKLVADPCKGFEEIITVELFGETQTNPITTLINDPSNTVDGEIVVCPNDGDELPQIFLCGLNDTELIQINIPDADSIEWELLDESSCTASADDCANKNNTCIWNTVATGNSFLADAPGQYRLIINYQNGCFSRFYFNVFQNTLDLQYTSRDIVCETPGNITITNLGNQYGYELYDVANNTVLVPYSANNGPSFDITANGAYRVNVTQLDASGIPINGACVFSTDDIGILDRDITVDITTTAAFCNSQGTIQVDALNVFPNYSYELRLDDGTPPPPIGSSGYYPLHPGGTLVDDETANPSNSYTFSANEGSYFVIARTDDGCIDVVPVTVDRIPDPTVTAITTANIGCEDGEIELSAANGNPASYSFAIWSVNGVDQYADASMIPGTDYQTGTTFTFSAGEEGDYQFIVVDANNCIGFSNEVSIVNNGVMTIDSISAREPSCSGEANGELTINITGGVGPFQYSIDNGVSYQSSPTFAGLTAMPYAIRVIDSSNCDVTLPYTLNQPFPLSASAGVSRDATCDPAGAEVRITNVVGGTAPYEYSFDGGASWGASSTRLLPPGNYTVLVRDGSCSFSMNVTVAGLPMPPDVALTPEVNYNCDGTGTITASPSIAGYDYRYALDGVLNTPEDNNVFTNVAPGTYTVTTFYASSTPPSPSLLLSEDFGFGATIPNPNTQGYFYENQLDDTSPSGAPIDNGRFINDYEYAVTDSIARPFGAWLNPVDHTTGTRATDGRYLVINIGAPTPGQIIYQQRINDIIPNQALTVSLFGINLLRSGRNGVEPDLTIELRDPATGTIITSATTGPMPENNNWTEYLLSLNPGAFTSLDLTIVTNESEINGNDVAIDDITVFQTPEVCELFVETPVTVLAGLEFNAAIQSFTNVSCNGFSDGSITFEVQNFNTAAGFDFSTDGGTTWLNANTSPVTTGNVLPAGNQTILLRKTDDTSCATTLTQILSEPSILNVTASVTTALSCTNDATITANATGGTATYSYQLEDDLGVVIGAYDFASNGTNSVFNGIPAGSYLVRVRDANGCETLMTTPLVVDPVNPLVFDVSASGCYAGGNSGSIIVNVTDGNGNYQFRINSGPWLTPTPSSATSYTFNGLTNGTYDIDVRDGSGCPVTPLTETIVIDPQLTANAILTTDLTCLTDASIDINANGGDGNYSYEWSNDGGAIYNSTGFTLNTFTTNTAGTYQFRVTDTSSPIPCSVITNPITVSPAETPIISNVLATNVLCFGDTTGTLNVSIDTSVGLPPYVTTIVETLTTTNYGAQTTGLPAGNYEVTITDAKGCVSAPFPVNITQPNQINYTIDLQPITCDTSTGTNPGSISVENLTGGTAEYTYYLTGNNGYSATYVTTAGGEDHTFAILEFGIYEVDVVDANGCSRVTTNIIASPPDDLNIDISATTVDCLSGGTADVTVTTAILGNDYEFGILDQFTVPYATSFLPPNTPGGATRTFTGLTPGLTYTFVVRDNITNCYYFEEAAAPINTPSLMTSTLDVVNNVTCTGAADGNVTFTLDGFDASATQVSYEVFLAQSNTSITPTPINGILSVNPPAGPITVPNLGPLGPGIYFIQFTEMDGVNAGCSVSSIDFTIDEASEPLTVMANSPTNDNCNVNAGVITAVAQSGAAPYEYLFLPDTAPAPTAVTAGWSSNNTANVESGNYVVYVMDAFGCIQSDPVTVLLDANPDISVSIVDECTTEGDFEILVALNNPVTALPPFQLSVNGSAFQTIAFNASNQYIISSLFSGLGQTVTLRDVNGCDTTQTIDIGAPLVVNASLTTLLDCETSSAGNAEITVDIVNGSGPYEYEIDGPGTADLARTPLLGSSVTWNGAATAGTYVVTVYDMGTNAPNCLVTNSLEVPPLQLPTIAVDAFTDVSCHNASDGTISVNANPDLGIGPYTFEIVAIDGVTAAISPTTATATTATFTGLAAATTGTDYTVRVTAGNSCAAEVVQQLVQPEPIGNVVANVVEFACSVGNNLSAASISVDTSLLTGGSGNFVRFQFVDTASGTAVQDGNNPVFVTTVATGGNFDVFVYDDNGCRNPVATNVDINPFIAISDPTVNTTAAVTCNPGADAQIQVLFSTTPATATINASYTVTGINVTYTDTNNTGLFTGLEAGNYSVEITNLDTGCVLNTVHSIEPPEPMDVLATKLTDEECLNNGIDDGSFEISVANYLGNFDYALFDVSNTPIPGYTGSSNTGLASPIFANLPGGSYYVRVTQTQAPFCVENSNVVTINVPDAPISVAVSEETSVSCTNDQGSLLVSASGGEGPYTIVLNNTTTGQTYTQNNIFAHLFTGLSAGDFTITVTDTYGCDMTNAISLIRPDAIVAALTASALVCFGDADASINTSVGARNVMANYTYELNTYTSLGSVGAEQTSAPQPTGSFSNLAAGFYSVTVTDNFGCSTETPIIEILNPSEVGSLLIRLSPLSCTMGASLELSANGGTAPYSFSEDGVTYAPMNQANGSGTHIINNVGAGSYQYFVRDAFNCFSTVSNTITEDPIAPLTLEVDQSAAFINCTGDGTAAIFASADGGLGNYQYALFTDPGLALSSRISGPNSSGEFRNLTAGTYYVQVTSEDCTAPVQEVVINEPLPLAYIDNVSNISCAGEEDGSISVTLSGGAGGYLYSISPNLDQFDVVNTFTDLAAGDYTVIAQDQNGCFELLEYTITEPSALSIETTAVLPETCVNSSDGSIEISISGGTAPYLTSLNANQDADFVSSDTLFDALPAGTHVIFVRDAQGCDENIIVEIAQGVNLNATVTPEYSCDGLVPDNRLLIDFEDESVINNVMFAVDTEDASAMRLNNDFSNLSPGTHFLAISHSNGCVQRVAFEIEDFEPLSLVLQQNTINEITAIASGGLEEYTYTFDGVDNGNDNTLFINRTDTYEVMVTDANGCSAVAQIAMEFIDIEIPEFFTPDGDGINDTWMPRNTEGFPEILIYVYDRYGRNLGEMGYDHIGWNGMYQNNPLPTGDYWYVIKLEGETDDREFVGHFTLYR